jgi:hypothetical protein
VTQREERREPLRHWIKGMKDSECRRGNNAGEGPRLIVPVIVAVLAVWGCPAPGKGAKAERGYATARPIIDALAAYYRDNRGYPSQLALLRPHYLNSASAQYPITRASDIPSGFTYRADSGDYVLSFRYTGPGSNECRYRGSVGAWTCSGLF